MPDRYGHFTPPASDGLPKHGKDILDATYTSCRTNYPQYPKARCSQIAWGAVHRAGYFKLASGHWARR